MNEDFLIRQKHIDSVLGECMLICSPEMVHDLAMYRSMIDTPKTGPITEQEATEWKDALQQLNEMDWKGAYERVKIEKPQVFPWDDETSMHQW